MRIFNPKLIASRSISIIGSACRTNKDDIKRTTANLKILLGTKTRQQRYDKKMLPDLIVVEPSKVEQEQLTRDFCTGSRRRRCKNEVNNSSYFYYISWPQSRFYRYGKQHYLLFAIDKSLLCKKLLFPNVINYNKIIGVDKVGRIINNYPPGLLNNTWGLIIKAVFNHIFNV